jgi:hypothetical protein
MEDRKITIQEGQDIQLDKTSIMLLADLCLLEDPDTQP